MSKDAKKWYEDWKKKYKLVKVGLESPPDVVKFLYALHKKLTKDLGEWPGDLGFTPEDAFWTVFAVVAGCLEEEDEWEEEDEKEHEVRLSELLRLYLTVYCEDLNPNLAVADEPDFLEHLRKKFYAVREILLQPKYIEDTQRELDLWLRSSVGRDNVVKRVGAAHYIFSLLNAISPLPFRFVQDV